MFDLPEGASIAPIVHDEAAIRATVERVLQFPPCPSGFCVFGCEMTGEKVRMCLTFKMSEGTIVWCDLVQHTLEEEPVT